MSGRMDLNFFDSIL